MRLPIQRGVQLETGSNEHCTPTSSTPSSDLDKWSLLFLAAMHGRDVFVRMATGSGKSLCMFLVSLAVSDSGMGVVISPLNALMDQQVRIYRVLL